MNKSYNPFKMWGSWAGGLILGLISPPVAKSFGEFMGMIFTAGYETFSDSMFIFGYIFAIFFIFGFLIGWAIHSYIRLIIKIKNLKRKNPTKQNKLN